MAGIFISIEHQADTESVIWLTVNCQMSHVRAVEQKKEKGA